MVCSSFATAPRQSRGLSLVESLVAMAIVASAAAASVPGLTHWRAQLAVQQAAAEFETDVHLARSLALARNESLRLAFDGDAGARCWVVHSGPRDACRCVPQGEPVCIGGATAYRQGVLSGGQPVRLDANVGAISFEPIHGTAAPAATVRFSAPGSRSVHQVVGIMGRVRSCVPGGGLPGFRAC
jgi:type IV fimbrial biogenesis protein FimT